MKQIALMGLALFGMVAAIVGADMGERWWRKRRYVRGWRARYGDDGEPI